MLGFLASVAGQTSDTLGWAHTQQAEWHLELDSGAALVKLARRTVTGTVVPRSARGVWSCSAS